MQEDTGIEALREEVEELRELTQDTNKVVHKMRRAAWWGRIFTLCVWAFVVLSPIAAYYYWAQPYVTKAEQYYTAYQSQAKQATGWEEQAQQFFSKYLAAPSSSAPMVPQTGQ